MADKKTNATRRNALKLVSAAALTPAVSINSSAENNISRENNSAGKSYSPGQDNIPIDESEIEIFIDGLSIDRSSDVDNLERADLAIFGKDSSLNHDRIVSGINSGTAVAFVGEYAKRRLIGELQEKRPSNVTTNVTKKLNT